MLGMYNLAHIVLLVLVHMLQMRPSYEAPTTDGCPTERDDDSYKIEKSALANVVKVTVTCSGACDDSVAFQATNGEGEVVGNIDVDVDHYQDGNTLKREVCPGPDDSNRKYIFTLGTPSNKMYLKWMNDDGSELPALLDLTAFEEGASPEDGDSSESSESSESNSKSKSN